ncbi:MAG TPA: hypothetical protein VGH87_28660 [Polyangiaceae bacterium]|jgi:hypothetical protein
MIHPRQESVAESIVEVVAILVSAAVSWTVSAWIIKRDEKKLDDAMLARAYAPATLIASVFLFQQIAVLVHFIRTRRSFKGFFLGLAWAIAAGIPSVVLDAIFGLFLPDQ